MELKDLTYEHFAPLVGAAFQLTTENGQVIELMLTGAHEEPGDGSSTAFSILFRGPVTPLLQQRVYDVEHGDLGRLPIFLVPIAEENQGIVYQAVFTRLTER